jgi:hypothetical protein
VSGSAFGWLDHSEQQRRQMLEIVDLFREKSTVDELGAGVIRDALADHFFPGTSTLQTRARYFLFIPWIYLRLEQERVPSAQFDRRARAEQARLVKALVAGGERASAGVIGIDAGAQILRPPSILYWAGLRTLGILRYGGSYESYAGSLDEHHRLDRTLLRSDDGERIEESPRAWHGGLPSAPPDFLDSTTFKLSRDEADYLSERIVTARRGSLFAAFVASPADVARLNGPWQHPERDNLPTRLREDLAEAERFSLVSNGAYLLYNLMLAEASVAAGMTARERQLDEYRTRLPEWVDTMTAHGELLHGWRIDQLWQRLAELNYRLPLRTRYFFDRWAELALHQRDGLADNQTARQLIRERERALKGGLARLHNPRALENWGGASSVGRLDYRWTNVSRLLLDIRAGFRQRSTVSDA